MPLSSHNTHRVSALPFLDPKAIRQQLRKLIRHQEHLHQRETPQYTRMVIREIWQLVEVASLQLQDGKHPQALLMLQAITDVCTKQWMYLNNIHGDVSTFFQELARIWIEAFLTVDLTTQERTHWTSQVAIWQARLGDWSVRAAFDAPQAALREGWETPTLQRIFQGASLQQSVGDSESPAYATVLTHARLTVLEQREQFEHYLSLAKAEGLIREYVTMLVRQGQITEALSYGYQHLVTAEDALAVAQELFAYGERSHSLQMAEHGLTLEGNRVSLAIWLRDHSWSMGEQRLALKAGEIAFREEPSLQQYLQMAEMAGTQWPEQRSGLLDAARQAPWTADPQGVIRIFLHEHLFDDALTILKSTTHYTLVAEVVDAALEEQTALEWVIQACQQQAEYIMNGAKAAHYQAAVIWLTKVRTAYHMLVLQSH